MESKKKRKSSSTVKKSCYNVNKNVFENFEEYSDISEECLNSIFDATRNAERKASICTFTIETEKFGLAAVDAREFSNISYAPCFSSEIHVLSNDINAVCLEEDHKPRKRRKKLSSSLEKQQQYRILKVLWHSTDVTALSYTNGNLLLSCSLDGTIKAWDTNYQLVQTFTDTMKCLTDIHANSKLDYFVTSHLTGMNSDKSEMLYGASLFSFSRKDPIMYLLGHSKATQSARFHANGMYVATASRDGTVKMWSTQAPGRPVRTFQDGPPEREDTQRKAVAFSPDGKYLASTHYGLAKVWDIASGRLVQTLGSSSPSQAVNNVCFGLSGRQLATGGTDGQLRIWDVNRAADSFDAELSECHVMDGPILRIGCSGDIFSCMCSRPAG